MMGGEDKGGGGGGDRRPFGVVASNLKERRAALPCFHDMKRRSALRTVRGGLRGRG